MSKQKHIFTGPAGAGKSAAIDSICYIFPVSNDKMAPDIKNYSKVSSAVVLEYGVMKQEGVIGLVLLINNHSPKSNRDIHFFRAAPEAFLEQHQPVVKVICMGLETHPAVKDYHEQFNYRKSEIPVLKIGARENRDVLLLIETLLFTPVPGLVA